MTIMRRLREKLKSKSRSQQQTSPAEPALSSLSTLKPAPQLKPQPTPSPPASADSASLLPGLQERLWNQAYDELKASEHKVVKAYEEILSAELHRNDSTSVAHQPTKNEIGETWETRRRQMQQLVQAGLDRTQKEASIKGGIDKGLQAVQAVRGIVEKAVQASPQAAVAWVSVCLGLEVRSTIPTSENLRIIPY